MDKKFAGPPFKFEAKNGYWDDDEYINLSKITKKKNDLVKAIREIASCKKFSKFRNKMIVTFNSVASLEAVLAGSMVFLVSKVHPYLNKVTYKEEHAELINTLKAAPKTCRDIWKSIPAMANQGRYNHESDFDQFEAMPYLELKEHYDLEMEELALYDTEYK